MKTVFETIAKLALGKGIDKRFPFLVRFYKDVFSFLSDNKEYLVKIPLNSKLYVSGRDTGVGMYLRSKGSYEPELTKAFIHTVKKGNTVFDIGANVGYYTVLASKLVGNTGKVYAFEPDPQNLTLLKKNLAINKCKSVVIVKKALGKNKLQNVGLYIDPANPGESRLVKNGQKSSINVESTTIDAFVTENKLKKINVIKIDVEGRELWSLEGGKKTLSTFKNITLFFECNQSALAEVGFTVKDLLKTVRKFGFVMKHIIDEASKQKLQYNDQTLKQQLMHFNYTNISAVK